MSSLGRTFLVPGPQFDAGVIHAGDASATAPPKKPSLPDDTIALLSSRAELQPRTPAAKREWAELVGARHSLNLRTIAYVERTYAEWHADLEEQLEAANGEVVKQQAVLQNMVKELAESNQELVRLQNRRTIAQNEADAAAEAVESLSQFAPRKERQAAEKRLELAKKKEEAAVVAAGRFGEHLNSFKAVTVPRENEKLIALVDKAQEANILLSGRDPILAKYGFQQG